MQERLMWAAGHHFYLKAEFQDWAGEGRLVFTTTKAPHRGKANPEMLCIPGWFSPCYVLLLRDRSTWREWEQRSVFSPRAICWLHWRGKSGLTEGGNTKERTRLNFLILIRSSANTSEKTNFGFCFFFFFLRLNENVQKYFTGFKKKKKDQS